ncbi:hypothetical protein [Azospirillum thermophilum]|uniref:Lipoprotein n=1 Tax=Azospirillum thermophilum TaxID=2202148 RepID=A0A2S2CQH3_9PROT|nr:hypothetical protein [Azospirillum thermophilum]AWK86722.1 hypothetical protein DEW08_11160 [Azospirillum thermophilum]
MARGRRRLILLSLLALAGCSGEPAEGDMRTVVEAHTRRALERQGNAAFRSFDSFRKQGCVEAKTAPGKYDCYYAATFAPQPGGKPLTVNGKGRFHQTDKGLQFEDLGAQPR